MIKPNELVGLIFDYLSTHPDLQSYDGLDIYFRKNLDLKDIDEDFEKGLPKQPILTVFMKSLKFNPDKESAYKKKIPDVVVDVVVPDPDRETAYNKSLDFALKVSTIIDNDFQFSTSNKIRHFLTESIDRIGGKKFSEKGVYSPQRITFLIQL